MREKNADMVQPAVAEAHLTVLVLAREESILIKPFCAIEASIQISKVRL
jgi:hypothetical protein